MSTINTVTGPIPAKDLGLTLPHEHVFINHKRDNWMGSNVLDDPVLAEQELIKFKETRNYVQRVIENLHVYRHLIRTDTIQFNPESELRR